MARFRFDEDDTLVADDTGDVSYDEAVNSLVEEAVAQMEMALWDLADALEHVVSEEMAVPSNKDDEDAPEDEK
jgi:hypothetical protein